MSYSVPDPDNKGKEIKIIVQNDIPSVYADDDGIMHCNLLEFLLKPEILL